MNYHYCQFCFKKTAQGSDIVRFCSHCGKSFCEVANATPNVQSTPTANHPVNKSVAHNSSIEAYRKILAKRGIRDDEDDPIEDNDGDEVDRVPSISKLDIEVEIQKDRGVPIRSLASNSKREPRVETKTKPVKINKKKFLQEYQRQASSLRPKK